MVIYPIRYVYFKILDDSCKFFYLVFPQVLNFVVGFSQDALSYVVNLAFVRYFGNPMIKEAFFGEFTYGISDNSMWRNGELTLVLRRVCSALISLNGMKMRIQESVREWIDDTGGGSAPHIFKNVSSTPLLIVCWGDIGIMLRKQKNLKNILEYEVIDEIFWSFFGGGVYTEVLMCLSWGVEVNVQALLHADWSVKAITEVFKRTD